MKIYAKPSLLILLSFIIFLNHCSLDDKIQKYRIKKGKFIATLSETGELDAVNSRVITVPYIGWKYGWNLKLIGLKNHGSEVMVGDSIAQLDPQNVLKYLNEKENQHEIEQATLNKLIAEHQNRQKSLLTELATAKATLDLNKVQLDKHQFASERKRKIKELEYKKATIQYNKTKKKYELTQKIMKNELIIQQTKISQLQNEITDSKQALLKLRITSPLNGMLQILKNRRTNQTSRIGDELWQGAQLVSVPDLSEMKVIATVNEMDIGKIYLNQPVTIKLDAFPKVPFHGKISEIGKLSFKKGKNDLSKVFEIVILMEKSDPILKPGMTVRCDIIVAKLKDVCYVENNCVYKDGKSYYLLVSDKGRTRRCDITVGAQNNQYTVVYGDFKVGQKVIPAEEFHTT